MKGETTMLSKINHSIKDLTVPATLTEAEGEYVQGGDTCTVGTSGVNCTFEVPGRGLELFLYSVADAIDIFGIGS